MSGNRMWLKSSIDRPGAVPRPDAILAGARRADPSTGSGSRSIGRPRCRGTGCGSNPRSTGPGLSRGPTQSSLAREGQTLPLDQVAVASVALDVGEPDVAQILDREFQ